MKILINGIEREMIAAEIEEYKVNNALASAEQEAAEQAAAEALEARKEPLRRLGLTEDEINTVLGL